MYNETLIIQKMLKGEIVFEDNVAVVMEAEKNGDNRAVITINIQSLELYEAYKDECDSEIAAFKQRVDEM